MSGGTRFNFDAYDTSRSFSNYAPTLKRDTFPLEPTPPLV